MTETATYILDRVAPVFNKHGYVATSLSDLTQATGLTKGAIYCNFKNKQDLALQAFELNIRRAIAPMYEYIGAQKTGLAMLYATTNYHRNYYEIVKDQGGCPIIRVAMDAKFNAPTLYQAAKRSMQKLMKGLIKIIEKGKSDGSLNECVDSRKEAQMIYTILEGSLVAAFNHDDRSFIDQAMDYIDKHIIDPMKV